ncbi:hypothetical protein Ancab_037401 [Ancistrocladus abbreviatus]
MACLSGHKALKHCAFSRGLQYDVSLAVAWACLGKLYRELGDKQLARQEFDRARSIDPSLALPWAGMSADVRTRESVTDEVYKNCLRAIQIMLLAKFQIGLALLTVVSGHLSSSQVKQGSDDLIDMQSGVGHLKKTFHMYPNSTSIRHINFINGLLETILRLTFWHTLCRVLAAADNYINLKGEYMRCLNLQTYYPIGWMCLKFIKSQYDLLDEKEAWVLRRSERRTFIWKALLGHQMETSTLEPTTLYHRCVDYLGVRVWSDVQNITSLLTHYGESSNGPACMLYSVIKPAEIYFQMYLLEKQSTDGSQPSSGIDGNEILQRWILKAIHLNPSCLRYWKTLLNYVDWAAEM